MNAAEAAMAGIFGSKGSGGGSGVKTLTYTGTGSTSQSITFPDTPFMIMGFTQNPIEDRYTRGLIPFIWNRSNSQLCLCWSDIQSTAPQTNTFQFYSNMRVTISGNTVSWTGSDASQALNQSGTEYTIYYI